MPEQNAPLDCYAAMRQLWDYLTRRSPSRRCSPCVPTSCTCGECYGHYDFARHFLDVLEAQMQAECAPSALHARVREALRVEGFAPKYDEW
jgi:hypothetical protein